MKHKLGSKYEDLVNYVTDRQGKLYLSTIIEDFKSGSTKSMQIIDDLNTDYYSYLEKLDELIPIITDIYNDNYSLDDPEYYWKFNELASNGGDLLYAFKYFNENSIGLSTSSKTKMTKARFSRLLANSNTKLKTDNFKTVWADSDE